MEPTQNR